MKRWLLAAVLALPIHPQVIPGSPFTGGSGGGGSVSYPLLAPNGTAGAPSYSFANDTDSGMYVINPGAGASTVIGANAAGVMAFSAASTTMAPGTIFGWEAAAVSGGFPDTGLARTSAGVLRVTTTGVPIRALLGGGAAVASASAMPVPTGGVFHVTGTTNITSITSTNFAAGVVVTLIFDGILTFTDGNNLVIAGNFVTTADDTITLAYDGTNWYEVARAVN